MILKKLVQILKLQWSIVIFDVVDSQGVITQWLGTGGSAFLLEGVPYLDIDNFCALFDITEKQRTKLSMKHRVDNQLAPLVSDLDDNEKHAVQTGYAYQWNEQTISIINSNNGVLCVNKSFLEPFTDVADSMSLVTRTDSRGVTFVAVKMGLLLKGIIFPFEGVSENTIEVFEEFINHCREIVDRQKEEHAND